MSRVFVNILFLLTVVIIFSSNVTFAAAPEATALPEAKKPAINVIPVHVAVKVDKDSFGLYEDSVEPEKLILEQVFFPHNGPVRVEVTEYDFDEDGFVYLELRGKSVCVISMMWNGTMERSLSTFNIGSFVSWDTNTHPPITTATHHIHSDIKEEAFIRGYLEAVETGSQEDADHLLSELLYIHGLFGERQYGLLEINGRSRETHGNRPSEPSYLVRFDFSLSKDEYDSFVGHQ